MRSPRVSRRDFVSATAAAVAFPYVISSSVLARRGRTGPNDKIAIGIIGMGKRGMELQPGFLAREDCRVIAVCDVDKTRRDHAKSLVDKHYGDTSCEAYNSSREMLSHDKVDAVVIATPDHWHVNQVIDAARAMKDIYCEKPLTLNLREGKVMIDIVRMRNLVFQTGSQQRTEFEHKFVKACEYVRAGRIGRILSVTVGVGSPSKPCDLPGEPEPEGLDWDRWLGPAPLRPYNSILSPKGVIDHYPKWREYREYSGGGMTDFGAHNFDIAQWGLNMDTSGPVEVIPPGDGAADRGARLVYANGVEVTHGGPDGITFVGEKGLIHVFRDRLLSIPDGILKEPLKPEDPTLPRHSGHIANWVECIKSRERPVCDVEVGARSIACAHLCNLAYWHRRRLRWDPNLWTFPNDPQAQGWMDYQRRDGYEMVF